MSGKQCFLDIDIGDAAAHAAATAKYDLAVQWLAENADTYGLPSNPQELDAEQQETVREAIASTPAWSGRSNGAPPAFAPPPALRAGRIVVELFDKECPKTAENFRALCTGEKGVGKASGKALHYKGCKLHRLVKGFCAQGGDFVRGDGSAGDSIFGGKFNDEKEGLKLKHDRAGVLSMANSGKNSNSSQFFFTLAAAPQCDGKHVVFGKVVQGLEVLQRLNEVATASGDPTQAVVIADCGVL
eukprot:m.63202 g.63202  ORF g.63202 m.63202 type:complete len:243 (+) comp13834_c0_seq2:61-789(+)